MATKSAKKSAKKGARKKSAPTARSNGLTRFSMHALDKKSTRMFAALDSRERDLVDELVADHPGLVPLVPRVASGAREDAVRADLVEAVHGALAELGRLRPLLVVVEDVHWADESTRDLLTLLFTRGLSIQLPNGPLEAFF